MFGIWRFGGGGYGEKEGGEEGKRGTGGGGRRHGDVVKKGGIEEGDDVQSLQKQSVYIEETWSRLLYLKGVFVCFGIEDLNVVNG